MPLTDSDSNGCTVSIITPTYNRANLLSRALDSALRQSFQSFELLVIDDGSTDETAELMARYTARDSRVRYLVQPANAGVSAARNRGFREARGRFFALLDSDDEWCREKLKRQVAAFETMPPEVGLIYTAVETLGPDRWIHHPEHQGDLSERLLVQNVIHGTSSVMLRREAVEQTGEFDEGIPAVEDWDYWIRLSQLYQITYLPEVLGYYHDAKDDAQRKSLIVSENREAREWIFRKHEKRMRAAGVAHLYLIESARRHLLPPRDSAAARELLLRAIRIQPRQTLAYLRLLRLQVKELLPTSLAAALARRKQQLHSTGY